MNGRPDVGDRQAIVTTFTDEAGTPTSPTVVVAEVRAPSGTLTALSPAETGPGVWRAVLPAYNEGGVWRWYIAGTAGVIAADQGVIHVDRKTTAATV